MTKYFTKKGLEKLKKELHFLENEERKRISERLQKAISFGDLSENAEYKVAKEEQAMIEGRILELRQLLAKAKVVEQRENKGKAVLGSEVQLSAGKEILAFTLVNKEEADLERGFLSVDSPLGRAILGKKKGEKIELETPNGKKIYKILKIS
jgi:transcription elongation factor GreA